MSDTSKREFDVIAVGDLNVDLVLSGCPLPEPGKERLAEGMNYTLGSSAAIFASNLASLGSRVAFVARVGADAPGRFLMEELAARGVGASAVKQTPEFHTGITVILTLPGQEQKALLTYRGAMEHLVESDVPDELLQRARHVHVGSYYMLPELQRGCARLFDRAHAAGLTTSLDTNDDPDERWDGGIWELLRRTDIFFPNRREALGITGEADLAKAGAKLASHARIVAMKADMEGALLFRQGDGPAAPLRLPALQVDFVEATGAGDSFDAGFLSRYLSGAPLDDCLRFGNACGALAVTYTGGTEAFRQPDAMEKLADLGGASFR
jgi:sugar/nucleoside kinase (ribokinase family)